jgi:uncharacterized protein (TIGR03086 family)
MGLARLTTTGLIDSVSPSQLGDPTPCTAWTVRDLINHVTADATVLSISAERQPGRRLQRGLEGGERALALFARPGALEKTIKLPFGEMPAGVFLNLNIFDVATHAADLARACGQTITDTDLLESALEIGCQMISPEMRRPGVLDAEQPVPADATVADRLLAFAGRKI